MDSKLCPKCGAALEPPGSSGGRPRRWCSDSCQRSGEAKMRRIGQVLRNLEKDRAWHKVHSSHAPTLARFDAEIATQQACYDRLAGCPERKG